MRCNKCGLTKSDLHKCEQEKLCSFGCCINNAILGSTCGEHTIIRENVPMEACEMCAGKPWKAEPTPRKQGPRVKWDTRVPMPLPPTITFLCPACKGSGEQVVIGFDNSNWYSTEDDVERLTCTDPDEAVTENFNDWAGPSDVEENTPITVYAYKHRPFTRREVERHADRLLESFLEFWSEDHADPEEFLEPSKSYEVRVMRLHFCEAVAKAHVAAPHFMCEISGEREYSKEEVVKLLLEDDPEFFDE